MLQWKLLVKSTLSLILSDSFLSEVRTEHLGSTQHFDKKYEITFEIISSPEPVLKNANDRIVLIGTYQKQ